MNKKILLSILVLLALIVVIVMVKLFFNGGEDNWIRQDNGIWIRHGNSSEMPIYVQNQFNAVSCAFVLYTKERISGKAIDSQCLGNCGEYAIDIISVPRSESDDLIENQCADFVNGKTTRFIELDKEGKILRVSD